MLPRVGNPREEEEAGGLTRENLAPSSGICLMMSSELKMGSRYIQVDWQETQMSIKSCRACEPRQKDKIRTCARRVALSLCTLKQSRPRANAAAPCRSGRPASSPSADPRLSQRGAPGGTAACAPTLPTPA